MGKKKFKYEPTPEKKPEVKPAGYYLKESGVLYIDDEFNKDTIMPVVKAIQDYNCMPEGEGPEVIRLYINSPGGRISYCWQLVDVMKTSKIPVMTIGTGLVASCGLMTCMAGERRVICHNTQVMSHQFSAGSGGKEHELFSTVKSFELMSESIMQHYMKCTGKSERVIRKNLLHQTDVWLTPEECVKFNIADEILVTY